MKTLRKDYLYRVSSRNNTAEIDEIVKIRSVSKDLFTGDVIFNHTDESSEISWYHSNKNLFDEFNVQELGYYKDYPEYTL